MSSCKRAHQEHSAAKTLEMLVLSRSYMIRENFYFGFDSTGLVCVSDEMVVEHLRIHLRYFAVSSLLLYILLSLLSQ